MTKKIVLGHGSGGKMTHDLIRDVFHPFLTNPALSAGNDSAVLSPEDGYELAISVDSHVVEPLFFPGGDIGRLAVCGTVNDVAMSGAEPLYLTAGFILEEGLDMVTLGKVLVSMKEAAEEAGIQIVAGDTKVVQKGKGDKLFVTTSGIGKKRLDLRIGGQYAKAGDVVLVSGTLGDHGIAVVDARGELGLSTKVESDVAPLNGLIKKVLEVSSNVHTLRDPTRGGLATSLNEIAGQSNVGIELDEESIPVRPEVAAACEVLGFDPLYMSNEGKLIVIAAEEDANAILAAMQEHQYGNNAAIIGRVTEEHRGRVLMKTALGSRRVVDVLMGELLPRIC